ncbi:hypothetical protein BD413DRAFT_273189 [Trametes elegans]|nr:hypothetical protein BD413DRAFT_273189 [Trametes elegans]
MLAFQVTVGSWPTSLPGTELSGFDIFFGGCLPMLVAMYPTVIILIVALQRSISHPQHGIFSTVNALPISVRLNSLAETSAQGNSASPSRILGRLGDDEDLQEGNTYKAEAEGVLSAHPFHWPSSVVHICGPDHERCTETTRSDEEKPTS